MSGRTSALVRLGVGAGILVAIVWRLGAGPILAGLRSISVLPVLAALVLTAAATLCCAWRWSIVAHGLGLNISLRRAVSAYYRSQFLNTWLPGGVLGDVDRAVSHGRKVGDVGRGVRAVVWERAAGQAVQLAVALVVLLVLPSPVRPVLYVVAPVVLVVVAAALMVVRALPREGSTRPARALRTLAADRHAAFGARRARLQIVAASTPVVVLHAATFVVAARAAGATVATIRLVPLALVVLLAMSVPLNVGGWGPREGVAAWLFGAAGLGADTGLAIATVYGVLALVASLPGAGVLLSGRFRLARAARRSRPGARRLPVGTPLPLALSAVAAEGSAGG